MQFTTEYFIDQEKYFSLILLHINAAFCIGLFAIIGIGTMLFVYLQFICGMFKISRYETNIDTVIKIQIINRTIILLL